MKKIMLTRRQMLTMACTGAAVSTIRSPIKMLLRSLTDGIISNAQADELGTALSKNYVFLYLPAGIPRWHFDLLLRTGTGANASALVPNDHIKNQFDKNNGFNPIYTTVTSPAGMPSGMQYEMPVLWGSTLPTPSGATVPMTALLQNFLSIRGVNMITDNHGFDAMKQIQPISGGSSIDGMVASASNRTIPAIGDSLLPPGQAYQSPSGIGQLLIPAYSGNPVSDLLTPFNNTKDTYAKTSTYMTRRQAMDTAIQAGLSSLASFASSSSPGSSSLFSARSNAESLLRTGIGSAASAYPTLLAKYNTLIKACITAKSIPGVNDFASLSISNFANNNPQWLNNSSSQNFVDSSVANNTSFDLMTMITTDTTVSNLASSFAVAEYMIGQGYSSAAVVGAYAGGFSKFNMYGSVMNWDPDEHYGGTVPSIMNTSFYFQAFSACLYELIQQFKAAGIWNNTVIHCASEFGRTPNTDGSGSGHGISSNNVTLFSGAINGPWAVGNVINDGTSIRIPGSWGSAANVNFDGGGIELGIGHVASTVCSLLGVASPTPNNSSVVSVNDGGGVVPLLGMENV